MTIMAILQAAARASGSGSVGNGPRFVRHMGIAAPLLLDNVDTDVISPLKPAYPGVPPEKRAFEPIRFHSDGREKPEFVLNQEPFRRASILLVGKNFGTGSSRSVAVSRPLDGGIRVVIGESFGPLFYDNSVRLGLLAVALPGETVERIAGWAVANPGVSMLVDLERQVIEIPGMQPIPFKVEPRVRDKLLQGLTEVDELNRHAERIEAFENEYRNSRPWIYGTGGGR